MFSPSITKSTSRKWRLEDGQGLCLLNFSRSAPLSDTVFTVLAPRREYSVAKKLNAVSSLRKDVCATHGADSARQSL